MSQGFASLGCVNLEEVFQVRVIMKTLPMFMREERSFQCCFENLAGGYQKGPVDGKRRGVDRRMETVSIFRGCCYSAHREEALSHNAGRENVWHNPIMVSGSHWSKIHLNTRC